MKARTTAAVSNADQALDRFSAFFKERSAAHGIVGASLRVVGHSGSQNGFISHLYLDPAARAGYVVSFNTDATGDALVPHTKKLDPQVREFFVANVALPLQEAPPKPRAPPER